MQKYINPDLRFLCKWLKANKISLNATKTELIIFRHPNKQINYDLKIKIDGKILIPSKYVKYLGIKLDSHLNWHYQANDLSTRLSRAIGMISKIRHYVTENTLRMIYFGIFSSLLTYGSQIWGQFQNCNIRKLSTLQNRVIRIISFAPYNESVDKLYKDCKILKLADNVKLQNFLLAYDHLKVNLPPVLKNIFTNSYNIHYHATIAACNFH